MAKQNSILFLRQQKLILSLFGAWMLPYRNLPYKFYTSCILVLDASFLTFNFIHMVVVWGDFEQMSEGSYLLFTHISTCSKLANFVLRSHTFRKVLEAIDASVFASRTKEHDAILSKHSNRIKKINMMLLFSVMCNCALWGIIPQMDKEQKLLPFNVWMPGDTQTFPNYELGYAYQMLMVCSAAPIYMEIDVIFIALILFTCAQLEMIMANALKIQQVPLSGLSRNERKEIINHNNQKLLECIRHHQAATRFLQEVKNMFHIPVFIQTSASMIIVCVIGVRICNEPLNTVHFYCTLIYFCVILVQLFFFCWCGNELTVASEQLRVCMYICPWEGNDQKFKRTLCIAMECLRRPVIFNAGHFIPLSRPTFISILRCSYSYFAVLNRSQGK